MLDVLRLALAPADDSPPLGRLPTLHHSAGREHSAPSEPVSADALFARVAEGDAAALEVLHGATHAELWRFARTIVHDHDTASDVVQDVFVALWERRAALSVQGSARGYLFGAVRNRALHLARGEMTLMQRHARAARLAGESSPEGSANDSAEEADLVAVLRRAVAQLPERQRSAMLLRWNEGLNAAEIGRALEISDTAARKLLAKAETALRAVYERANR